METSEWCLTRSPKRVKGGTRRTQNAKLAFLSNRTLSRWNRKKLAPSRWMGLLRDSQNNSIAASSNRYQKWVYKAPDSLNDDSTETLDTITASRMRGKADACAICLSPMNPLHHPDGAWKPSYFIKVCGHAFHVRCFQSSFKMSSKRFPVCRKRLSKPHGCLPSGTMTITMR
jgi:hypothetical protein